MLQESVWRGSVYSENEIISHVRYGKTLTLDCRSSAAWRRNRRRRCRIKVFIFGSDVSHRLVLVEFWAVVVMKVAFMAFSWFKLQETMDRFTPTDGSFRRLLAQISVYFFEKSKQKKKSCNYRKWEDLWNMRLLSSDTSGDSHQSFRPAAPQPLCCIQTSMFSFIWCFSSQCDPGDHPSCSSSSLIVLIDLFLLNLIVVQVKCDPFISENCSCLCNCYKSNTDGFLITLAVTELWALCSDR